MATDEEVCGSLNDTNGEAGHHLHTDSIITVHHTSNYLNLRTERAGRQVRQEASTWL